MTATNKMIRSIFPICFTVVLMAQGTDKNSPCRGTIAGASFNKAYEIVATTAFAGSSKGDDSKLIDAFRNGHSLDLYPYVLWRNVQGRPEANIEIVFFDKEGLGLVFPACAQPTKEGFTLQLRWKFAGEFGHVLDTHDINFKVSAPAGIVKVDLLTTRKHSELVVFKKTETERLHFELRPRDLSNDVVARALALGTRLHE